MAAASRSADKPAPHGVRYPWPVWLNGVRRGGTLVLTRGEDFDCEPSSMGIAARLAARRHSVPVRVSVAGSTVVITLAA